MPSKFNTFFEVDRDIVYLVIIVLFDAVKNFRTFWESSESSFHVRIYQYYREQVASTTLLFKEKCFSKEIAYSFLENELQKSGSLTSLLRLPPVLITCIITTLAAMSSAFLDPTLEPHLRKSFGFTPSQVGLLFLLSSATYGLCSPMWGWLSDRIKNYSWLMTTGMFGTSFVLLLLGPSPVLSFLQDSVWLNAVALGGLGVSTAMTVIPTYQFMLDGAVHNGFVECLGTHSMISGLWGSVYSLGEVIGPIFGGTVMDNFNFAITASLLALLNFVLAIVAMIFFRFSSRNPKVDEEMRGVDNVVCCAESRATATEKKCDHRDNIMCVRL